ncbi:MAG: ATP-binding protein [Bacteroidales bacterium]|nr:ATP-binding protein [Bacteroidales bacterium]MBD5353240.1 ATP-binding protein [Bacteroides sp.]
MKRKIYNNLLSWKESGRRKPLILQGARQIGKSWILKEFGRREFENVAYISCDSEPLAVDLFADYDIKRIVRSVEAITSVPIVAGKTLIIFDEIQEVPRGLSALKYFYETAPEYHVAVAGSLLGITLHSGTSFPVGKVNFLEMHPMDFEEFLWAKGEERLADAISVADIPVVDTLHVKCVELLREYYFVGGMPEVVAAYVDGASLMEVRDIQKSIIEAYRNDISKHAPSREVERISLVLRSLPAQLAKENKKFVYSAIRKGSRAADFEIAIQWLIDAGILTKVSRISAPRVPLAFYEDFNAFKLYLLDCGLFGAMVDAPAAEILMGSKIFEEYKGAFTELFILQQLVCNLKEKIYYFSADNSRIEIDFILEFEAMVYPIEAKAEDNLKAKSLKLFREKFDLPLSIRLSMRNYRREDKLVNIPLYAAFALCRWI